MEQEADLRSWPALTQRTVDSPVFGRANSSADDYVPNAGWLSLEGVLREERVERRLAAILAADVAGYSRLMVEDECQIPLFGPAA